VEVNASRSYHNINIKEDKARGNTREGRLILFGG
jgi:hypothetical protein